MNLTERYPSLPYVAPFATFMILLELMPRTGIPQPWEGILRVVLLTIVLWFFSRSVISLRTTHLAASIAIGVATFVLWIGPDLLFPVYRGHWLFQNSITGSLRSSLSSPDRDAPLVLAVRSIRAIILVPIIEELFWRAWLPRWIQNPDFRKIPLGTYSLLAFAVTAVLFGSEHGPFWDVGLLTGVIYNWWMMRTRSLGDLVVTHAVTNACLSGYVIATQKWEYWL